MKGDLSPFKRAQARDKSEFANDIYALSRRHYLTGEGYHTERRYWTFFSSNTCAPLLRKYRTIKVVSWRVNFSTRSKSLWECAAVLCGISLIFCRR